MDPKKAENSNNSVQSSDILAFLISSPEILAQELELGLPKHKCTNSQGLCKIQHLYSPDFIRGEEALTCPNEKKRLIFLQLSILSISKTIKWWKTICLGIQKERELPLFYYKNCSSWQSDNRSWTFHIFNLFKEQVCLRGGKPQKTKTPLYIILDLQLSRFAATICLSTSYPETLALKWPFNALSHSSHLLLWQYRAEDSTESLNPAIEDKQVRILSEKLLLPSSH